MSEPLDEFLRRKQNEGQGRARVMVDAGGKISPEEAARRLRYRRVYGVDPPEGGAPLTGFPTLDPETRAMLADTSNNPRLQQWLARSPEHAAASRGSERNLGDISDAVGKAGEPKGKSFLDSAMLFGYEMYRWIGRGRGTPDAIQAAIDSNEVTLPNIRRAGAAGVGMLAGGAAGTVSALSRLEQKYSPSAIANRALFGDTPNMLAKRADETQRAWEQAAFEIRPKTRSNEAGAILSGVESIPLSVGALVGGAYTKSATVAASLMGVPVFGQSYGRGRDYGLSLEQSVLYGAIDAGIEIGTERLTFLKALDVGTPFVQRFGRTLVAEGIGEQLATFGQDFNAWANIEANQGKTFGDFLAERPEAAYQTAIATLVTTGAITGAVGGLEYASNKMGRTLARTAQTEDNRQFAENLGRLAQANAVLTRDRGTFEEFVRSAAEGTEATDVYVDAEQLLTVLDQSALTVEEVFDATGFTPEQLEEMAERGEDVSLPIEQYAARIAPTPLGEQLLDHLRLQPDQMSAEEAKVFLQSAKEEFSAEAEQGAILTEAQNTRLASRAQVEGAVLADLQRARRFTDDVNEVYASVVGAFFDTTAQRLGTTADELFKRYTLRVQSDEVAEPSYDQTTGGPLVNIGLDIPTGGTLDPQQVRDALTAMGLTISAENIAQSDTEQTFIGQLDRALTPEEAFALSEQLGQEAIAQFADGQGGLFGPQAANWGEFNPAFFLDLAGGRLASETFDQSAAPLQTLPLGVTGTGPGGRVRNWDLGVALTLRHRAKYGRALDPKDPADYAIALQALVEDYEDQKAQPDSGETWYSDDIAEALEITKRILPELDDPVRRDIFLTAVALLSPQQGPLDNWENAIVAMTGYSITGRFAKRHESGQEFGVASHSTGLALFEHLINKYGEIGALVWLNDEHTGREMEAIRRESGLFLNKADNYLPRETNKNESKLGVYIFGPKVGDFMLNSTGANADAVTVDLWMARTYNRVIGRLTDVNAKRAAEGGLADAMRGKAERAIVKQLVRDAAQQAGITPSAMQAALWYFEQRLYRNHGIKSESTSFSDAARNAAFARGIALDGPAAGESSAGRTGAESRDLEEGVRVYDQSGEVNPLDAFKRESFYPTEAVVHEDGTIYAAGLPTEAFFERRYASIAEKLGAKAVVPVAANAKELRQGRPLWHTRPPLNPDGTYTLHHWGASADITRTDPTRWGESGTLPVSERQSIKDSLPRTYFGIASGQPGGYVIEFPGRPQFEARVPADKLYDVRKDPDGFKPMPGVPALERKIKNAGYLGYWTNDDQLGLVAVVFEPLDVKPAGAQTMFQDAVFYSALERTLERTATQRASAQQWEATLRKTPGIKAEELEWTGIVEFLQMQDGPITRDQLLEVVRGAGIRVDEVVLGGAKSREELIAVYMARGLSREDAEFDAALSVEAADDAVNTQFAGWTTDPQNETYRELLITLPIGEGRNPNRAPSTHWDTDGVIAHARFMDKEGPNGERILFVEEVQSDWHQKGRDEGYTQTATGAQIAEARERLRELRERHEALAAEKHAIVERAVNRQKKEGAEGLGFTPLEQSEFDGISEAEAIAALQAREASIHLNALTGADGRGGIPNAPFRTDWPALVMKRMIRWAAEHGYDQIAWTTGEQQADRYNLSQAVEQLRFDGMQDSEGFRIEMAQNAASVLEANGLGRSTDEYRSGLNILRMTEGQMREAFGNDIAQRLIESDGVRPLEGADLRVGGEGMKAFYDRNLVNITNKLVKKYGAKVGVVQVRDEAKTRAQRQRIERQRDWSEHRALEQNRREMLLMLERTEADIANGLDPASLTPLVRPDGLRSRIAKLDAAIAEIEAAWTAEIAAVQVGADQWGFDLTPELKDAAMGGFPLFQRERAPRGQIAFMPDITSAPSTITLLRGADLSTFVHELGHFFFEVTNHIASQPGAPAEIVRDRDTMLRYLGVESVTEWENRTPAQRREGHERMARSFEAFLFEGRAPSLDLRSLFGKLRNWMRQVYTTIARLDVELTDEVRGAFTRMLASDEAIAEAEADMELLPLFMDKPDEMSDADWAAYQRMNEDAKTEAAVKLEARSLRDMRFAGRAVSREIKRLQKQVAEQRAAVREEVEAEINAEPTYRAISFFRTGKIDGEAFDGEHKLNTEMVRELLQLEDAPLPDALKGMTKVDGLNPEQAAELFGFTSADHLLKDILFASPRKDAIEAETDARMRERYGDLNTPEEVEEAARAAVHNDIRGRFVATELAALQKAPGKQRALAAAAKRLAEDMISRLRVRDIRPGQYEAAERRAAKAARDAGAQALDDAVRFKRNQLFNFHAAKAAHAARSEMREARDYLTKFGKTNTRKNIDQSFLDQIDQLLERYELRMISNAEADRRKSLAAWIEEQTAAGFEPMIDQETLDRIGRKNWRDLTVDEMRGLVDAIRNIEHIGRLTKKLLTAKDKADLDTAAGEMGQAVRDNAYKTVDEIVGAKTWWERVQSGARDYFAMHRKMANMVFTFDGNRYGGVFWERFIRPMNERGDWQAQRVEQANLRLVEAFKLLGRENTTKRVYVPEVGRSLSLEDRLMIALNWGNSANRQRLLDGDKWTVEQVEAILAPLQSNHWDFVERVWQEINAFWPEIAAKEIRVSGVAPEKVEAEPFQTEIDGQLRLISGGYFPIKYDPDRSSRAEADTEAEVLRQMTRGLYTRATTRRGHTKARAEKVDRPVLKNFSVIFGHVNQVIHDLAWHEYLIDANRLLRHPAVDSAIREHYGPETLRWLRKGLEDVATGDVVAQSSFDQAINYLRNGVTTASMAWSVWTSLLQPIGLTQSMARIGTKHVAKGIVGLLGSPKAMNAKLKWIYETSPFMRQRGDTMQREINEIRNRIASKSPLRRAFERVVPGGVTSAIGDSYFYLIYKAQLMADVPTWLGQYEKSVSEGVDLDTAARIADQAVIDAQSSGMIKDLAGIQRGSPLLKLWTNFYSYFSGTFNLMVDRTAEMKRVGPRDLPYFAVDMMLLTVVPATLTSLMYTFLRTDEDDPEEILRTVVVDNVTYLFGTMIGLREIAAAFSGTTGYQGPAGARAFAEFARLGKQVQQGEADEAAARAANSTAGILLHYPSAQLDRTVRGTISYYNGEGGFEQVAMGPPVER